jgi:DNA-binding response OmpR family regulator
MTSENTSKKPTWLVLEDDLSLQQFIISLFEVWGIRLLLFKTGTQAMAWLEAVEKGDIAAEHLPELALLDIRVPGPLGYEVGSKIRQTEPLAKIPIVMMTAYRVETSEKTLVKQKVKPDMFLVKPLPFSDKLYNDLQKLITKSKDTPVAKQAEDEKPAPKPPRKDVPPAADKEKVPVWLLLEDDYYIATVLTLVVEDWDVRLVRGRSLMEGRRILQSLKAKAEVPELAILDVKLPDGDGRALITDLREHGVKKIIVTSGMQLDGLHKDKIDLRLGKPLPEPEKLRELASELIGREVKSNNGTLGSKPN